METLVIARDAGPLLAQIRAGEVGVNQQLPWGGGFGVQPSYFTPLCAAAFAGALPAVDELLALGAEAEVNCGQSATPLDLVMRHPAGRNSAALDRLRQARGANPQPQPDFVVQARM